MMEFVQNHVSEFFSAFALILSAAANWRVVEGNRATKRTEKAFRRMDALVEIEKKNAAVGKLALITAQKLILIQQNPSVALSPEEEIQRLKKNLNFLQKLKDGEKPQRTLAESANGGDDVELHSQALADVQRLRIHIEAEVEKETGIYNQMLEEARAYRS